MNSGLWILAAIALPIVGGIALYAVDFQCKRLRELFVMAFVLLTSIMTIWLITRPDLPAIQVFRLTNTISIAFRTDGLGKVFAGLVAVLWPIASIYAFEYMSHYKRENTFFTYYTITFGITLGVAFSANLITMYLFYEMLTFITLPLITHDRSDEARAAGIKYIVYSIAGATTAFIGIIVFTVNGGPQNFVAGGLSDSLSPEGSGVFYSAFLLMFFGFGVKAAIFPLHGWLPTAGVAPTPVTALLHAVAVVKSGTFAIIRIAYYCFGAHFLSGSIVQSIALSFAIFTIVYGTAMAWKEMHLKKRLAYSTISNLSYILFGALLFTPTGLAAGLLHMLFHGIMKICLFFVAGAVIVKTEKHYVTELKGFGLKMPYTFAAFTVASLALSGIPPLCGFISKLYLAEAAVNTGGSLAYAGVAALLLASVFTAVYLFTIVVRAYFPSNDFDRSTIEYVKDPSLYMLLPFGVLSMAMVGFGLFSGWLWTWLTGIANGLFL